RSCRRPRRIRATGDVIGHRVAGKTGSYNSWCRSATRDPCHGLAGHRANCRHPTTCRRTRIRQDGRRQGRLLQGAGQSAKASARPPDRFKWRGAGNGEGRDGMTRLAAGERTGWRAAWRRLLPWLRWSTVAVLVAVLALDLAFPPPLPRDGEGTATVVTARDGTPLRAFADAHGIWRHPATADTVSPLYLEALLNYEDRWFHRHPGVNPLALARAGWQWLRSGGIVSGGSTLSMQVARILDGHDTRSVGGKLRQMARALQLEA